jgi:acetone carboxylase gamma subunit
MIETLVLRHGDDDRTHVHCGECGYSYGPAGRDPRLRAVTTEQLVLGGDGGDAEGDGAEEPGLLARRYYCPHCALLFAVGVRAPGEPVGLERTDVEFTFPYARAINDLPLGASAAALNDASALNERHALH